MNTHGFEPFTQLFSRAATLHQRGLRLRVHVKTEYPVYCYTFNKGTYGHVRQLRSSVSALSSLALGACPVSGNRYLIFKELS